MKLKGTLLSLGIAVAALSAGAQATSPPPSWTNLRVIECDGVQVTTYLAPPGFGTPFNVVGWPDVIIPKYVQVTVGGQTFVTKNNPGFDPHGPDVVSCSYTDPVGVFVEFLGIRK
jgi:hypothetical protein